MGIGEWMRLTLNGKWIYLYRAVDSQGNTIDFLLRSRRDAVAAKAFFRKAFEGNGRPEKVTVDKNGSNKAALDSFNKDVPQKEKIEIRQIKYLNNIIEQDHRFIKKRTKSTLGFKNFHSAKITIMGIENIRMIQKDKFSTRWLLTAYSVINEHVFRVIVNTNSGGA